MSGSLLVCAAERMRTMEMMPLMAEKRSRGEVRNQKLRRVAADLFLKRGYDGVSIDKIVELAGGSKSTVYQEFGGKCGLFISSIEELCRESNAPLEKIDYAGRTLEESLKTIAVAILELVTSRRAVELHRLAVGEALHCPEVGEAWYTHGPVRTVSYIRSIFERHASEIDKDVGSLDQIATAFYNALTGDVLSRLLAGITRRERPAELQGAAHATVELLLAGLSIQGSKR